VLYSKIAENLHVVVSAFAIYAIGRLLFDLVRDARQDKDSSFGLIGLTLSLLSGVIWSIAIFYLVQLPSFMFIWLDLTLWFLVISLYLILLGK